MNFDWLRLLILLCACGACNAAQADDSIVAKENALQAALLYNFALFTEWPQPPETNFKICVLDSPTLMEALDSVKSKKLKERPITITAINSIDQALSCQVLFVGNRAHPEMHLISKKIGSAPVLVVSEENAFDLKDVVIALSRQQDRISFKINLTAAKAGSLTLSSKLLKLATQVY